jgi:hypothetical protein
VSEDNTYSRRRLRYVVAEVSRRVRTVPLHGLKPELVPLVEATGAFVRGCWEAARGVLVLAMAGEYGGIGAAERQAWEMWNEVEFLLLSADPPRNGVKVQVNALIDVIELLTALSYPAEMFEKNTAGLAKFEASHPDVVDEVRQQRKKRGTTGRARVEHRLSDGQMRRDRFTRCFRGRRTLISGRFETSRRMIVTA